MAIDSMVSLAVARNERRPGRIDTGPVLAEETGADAQPTLPDLLAKSVPVGLVTAYAAFVSVVSEAVSPPTADRPRPDAYLGLRWTAFAALVLFSAGLTFAKYRRRAGSRARPPLLEVAAVTVAAAGWGLCLPESPLLEAFDDESQSLIALALIGFLAVGANLLLGALMRRKAS